MTQALAILQKYYPEGSSLYNLLLKHSLQVRNKALQIAAHHPELQLDLHLLERGAMLHDIGIFLCNATGIGCYGTFDYLYHGTLGGEILREQGLIPEAQICERHTGVGLQRKHFERRHLPIPKLLLADATDMALMPQSEEERVVCYADKFFSKSRPDEMRSVEETANKLRRFGAQDAETFLQWANRYE